MFGDFSWIEDRTSRQEERLAAWLEGVDSDKLVVIELGAGTAIPTVRWQCEQQGRLIRINPSDPEAPEGAISIPLGALEALSLIEALL